MSSPAPVLFFDYVDPLCYLLELELATAVGRGAVEMIRAPMEVRPPPASLLDPEGPWWTARWEAAAAVARARGLTLTQPRILPWTRKAHEFVLHARHHGRGDEAHHEVFDAIFGRGEDIGRVDVLVELARGLGLDPKEAKVVLDVDRYAEEVSATATRALEAGVEDIPTLLRGSATLKGFHNGDTLRTFLLR